MAVVCKQLEIWKYPRIYKVLNNALYLKSLYKMTRQLQIAHHVAKILADVIQNFVTTLVLIQTILGRYFVLHPCFSHPVYTYITSSKEHMEENSAHTNCVSHLYIPSTSLRLPNVFVSKCFVRLEM